MATFKMVADVTTMSAALANIHKGEANYASTQKFIHDTIKAAVDSNNIAALNTLRADIVKVSEHAGGLITAYIRYIVGGVTLEKASNQFVRAKKSDTLVINADIVASALWYRDMPKAKAAAKEFDLAAQLKRLCDKAVAEGIPADQVKIVNDAYLNAQIAAIQAKLATPATPAEPESHDDGTSNVLQMTGTNG